MELSTKNLEALKESSETVEKTNRIYCITSSYNPAMKYFLLFFFLLEKASV